MEYLPVKKIAQEIRTELKKQFPDYKFSVVSDVNSITIALMEAEFCPVIDSDKELWRGA